MFKTFSYRRENGDQLQRGSCFSIVFLWLQSVKSIHIGPTKERNFGHVAKKKQRFNAALCDVMSGAGYSHPGMVLIFLSALLRKGSSTTFFSASHAFSYSTVFWYALPSSKLMAEIHTDSVSYSSALSA